MIERSATGSTVVVALAVLLAEFGSADADATVAWLVIDPADCGVTLIWMVTEAPLAMLPCVQVTTPAAY